MESSGTISNNDRRGESMAEPVPTSHLWARAEYERMAEAGIFEADARIELIEGEILEMAPQASRHATAVTLIEQWVRSLAPPNTHVRVQLPLAIDSRSEPEPDVALVQGGPRDYRDAHPATALWVIEVADTSLGFDRVRKKRLYARNGLPEYWILDLNSGGLEVHRHPEGEDYAEKRIYRDDDHVALLAAPDVQVAVADLLP
jgi:Uma2 family endonuclease